MLISKEVSGGFAPAARAPVVLLIVAEAGKRRHAQANAEKGAARLLSHRTLAVAPPLAEVIIT